MQEFKCDPGTHLAMSCEVFHSVRADVPLRGWKQMHRAALVGNIEGK